MIAVIFEAQPHAHRLDAYIDAAAHLRPLLEHIDGFISIERFESLATPGKLLSLSFWRDAAAVDHWRSVEAHRDVQRVGRESIFQDYRLHIAPRCPKFRCGFGTYALLGADLPFGALRTRGRTQAIR